MKSDVIIIA